MPPVTSLLAAIRKAFIDMARGMLEHGVSANASDAIDGHTPLTESILADNEPMVRLLLQHGANIEAVHEQHFSTADGNQLYFQEFTALQLAAFSGAVNIIRALIQSCANVNVGERRMRPFELAIGESKYLRKVGDSTYTFTNIQRSKKDYCDAFRLLLDAGAEGVVSNTTALWAARCGDLELARDVFSNLLASAAGQPNPEAQYREALVTACRDVGMDVIRTMINAVDRDVWVRASRSAFNELCVKRFRSSHPAGWPTSADLLESSKQVEAVLEMATLMLEGGAVVDAEAFFNICSCSAGSAIIRLTLQYRPDLDVNAGVETGLVGRYRGGAPRETLTPLDASCRVGDWDAAIELLSHGAVPTRRKLFDLFASCRDYSSLSASTDNNTFQKRKLDLLRLLVESHGADVNARNSADSTVLQLACEKWNDDMVAVLLANGAVARRSDVLTAIDNVSGGSFALLVASAAMKSDSTVESTELPAALASSLRQWSNRHQAALADCDDSGQAYSLVELVCRLALVSGRAADNAVVLIPACASVKPDLFLLMVEHGCRKIVEAMLRKGVSADALNTATVAVLNHALTDGPHTPFAGSERVLHLLVRHGAQITDPLQLLQFACVSGNNELIQAIVDRFHGAEHFWPNSAPDGSSEHNESFGALLLNESVRASCFDVALTLVEAGCPVSPDALFRACKHDKADLALAILRRGVDPNAEVATLAPVATTGTSFRREGTPLEMVCESYCSDADEGAIPALPSGPTSNATVSDGAAETTTAAQAGSSQSVSSTRSRSSQLDLALCLLERCAHVTERALFGAIRNRSGVVIKAMLDCRGSIDINAVRDTQESLLEAACSRHGVANCTALVLLLEYGCEVTLAAIAKACVRRLAFEIVRLLLQRGGRALLDTTIALSPCKLAKSRRSQVRDSDWLGKQWCEVSPGHCFRAVIRSNIASGDRQRHRQVLPASQSSGRRARLAAWCCPLHRCP